MGEIVKKEVYTTRQPDGTYVTTTTTTTTSQETYVSRDWSVGVGTLKPGHCISALGILRFLQIVCGFIVVGLVTGPYGGGPYLGILSGQTYVLVIACLCVVVTFILLVVFFLAMYIMILHTNGWMKVDFVYSIIAAVLYLVAAILECWYASGVWKDNCNYIDTGHQVLRCGVRVPWVIAAIFCFVNVLLYAVGAWLSRKQKYYL